MEAPKLSPAFQSLYCNPAMFALFSSFHPISFARVLPFQADDVILDDRHLLYAEEALLAGPSDETRLRVVEAFSGCGLVPESDAANLKPVIDFFDADFFELMGLVYANARMFRCALRWYREVIRHLENIVDKNTNVGFRSDTQSVYASVGYCLYSLGLFEEAIAWSKACLGPRQMADIVCRALIDYEAEAGGGRIAAMEGAGPRMRYFVGVFDPAFSSQTTSRLKGAMKRFASFHEVYIDWATPETFAREPVPDGYPFQPEFDATALMRHKMNLIFATCGRADALIAKGYIEEAKRLLNEAAIVEPEAECLQERIQALR